MSLSADSKQFDSERLVEFFRFAIDDADAKTSSTYARAVKSLISFLKASDASLLPDTETTICDWVVHLWVSGLSLKTVIPYLKGVGSIYNKAVKDGLAPATDVFSQLLSRLKSDGASLWSSWFSQSDFLRLKSALQSDETAARMLLFSLTNGCAPLSKVASLKRDDLAEYDTEYLGESLQFRGNRRYVFPLGQSGLTPNQLQERANALITKFFIDKGISHAGNADMTARSYWAYAALLIGVSARDVRSCCPGGVPSGLPVLSLCRSREMTDSDLNEITTGVARMFTSAPAQWYAMRLRPRVRFDELEKKLEQHKDELKKPELFYPCEEILRRTGKKKAKVRKPIIPDLVFFKCREREVYPIFLRIGDIAWCYKAGGKAGSRYAAIPRQSFERFQQVIGQFTPDYEVAPVGELPPKEGDRIVIVGGLFENRQACVDSVVELPDDGRTICRFNLVSDNGASWNVGIDIRIAKKKL